MDSSDKIFLNDQGRKAANMSEKELDSFSGHDWEKN